MTFMLFPLSTEVHARLLYGFDSGRNPVEEGIPKVWVNLSDITEHYGYDSIHLQHEGRNQM